MPELFRRRSVLTVGTVRIVSEVSAAGLTGLDIAFNVHKSLKDEPNTAEIKIWNLTPAHRRTLEEVESVPVRLEAGYVGGTFQIFAGDLRQAVTVRDGADWVTTVATGDGETKHRRSRVNQGFSPGAALEAVLRALVTRLGVGAGNLDEFATRAALEGAGAVFPQGTVVSGRTAVELRRVLQSAGLEYSIQDGNLQLLGRGLALVGTAVRLAPSTGLVDVPAVDSKGVLKAKMKMIPDVFPGRKVQMDAAQITGLFRVENATYSGDTTGGDWGIEIEGKPV